jgi:hypothetical protein
LLALVLLPISACKVVVAPGGGGGGVGDDGGVGGLKDEPDEPPHPASVATQETLSMITKLTLRGVSMGPKSLDARIYPLAWQNKNVFLRLFLQRLAPLNPSRSLRCL